MIRLVITGGQTGADIGGWRAARARGVFTSGWMTIGYETERGPRPEYAREFGAIEIPEEFRAVPQHQQQAIRRRLNAEWADAIVLFGDRESRGSRGLIADAKSHERPLYWAEPGVATPRRLAAWLAPWGRIPMRLMVAGNRESGAPGIAARVQAFTEAAIRIVNGDHRPDATEPEA